ncbi:hypothetical protein ALC57_06980 [Trachymyrmex cornetzi]|uniref:Uncharacterized protein n=1 Tax=Trachymyrmex cornetzi TaxID=471704 RepID=A0A195E666_9HYME|nr:hypothetical protein ALC57_06980 [Trachymyrmex cornetzi]
MRKRGGKLGVRPQGRTSAREVAGISNFTERGLTRPTRGGEKLGQPPCVTSLPVAKTDANVEHRRALSFPVHPFKRGHLGVPRTTPTGGSGTLPPLITKPAPRTQKLNLSSSPHRRRRSGDENIGSDELPIFPNGYAALLLKSPPPAPPALLRRIGVKELTGVGKKTSCLQLRVVAYSSLSSPTFERVLPECQRDFYTNSGSDISTLASHGLSGRGRSRGICGQSIGTIRPRGPRGIHRIIGGHCGFRDSSSPSRTILEEHLNTDHARHFDSYNYPDFCFDLSCSN